MFRVEFGGRRRMGGCTLVRSREVRRGIGVWIVFVWAESDVGDVYRGGYLC